MDITERPIAVGGGARENMRHAIVISVNPNLVLKPGDSDAPGKIRQARAQIGGKAEKA
jgi:hypothetical protein